MRSGTALSVITSVLAALRAQHTITVVSHVKRKKIDIKHTAEQYRVGCKMVADVYVMIDVDSLWLLGCDMYVL